MEKLLFGDIVLIKFPFSDGHQVKKRPALVINENSDGDIIVCRITSQIYNTDNDILIEDWKHSGLLMPSVVRINKLATLEKSIVEMKIGKINNALKSKAIVIFSNLPN